MYHVVVYPMSLDNPPFLRELRDAGEVRAYLAEELACRGIRTESRRMKDLKRELEDAPNVLRVVIERVADYEGANYYYG
jgi:hypothetical protein